MNLQIANQCESASLLLAKNCIKYEKKAKYMKKMGVGKRFCSFLLGHKMKLIDNVSIAIEL